MSKSARKILTLKFIFFMICMMLLILSTNVLSQIEKELEELLNPTQKDSVIVSVKKKSLATKEIDTNEMAHIPAGNFIMGSDSFEIDERPVREIFLNEYWIDKFPVTNEQYASFLNSFLEKFPDRRTDINNFIHLDQNEVKIRLFKDHFVPLFPFGKHPVVQVTWNGATEYAKFYNKRLPTEAEWEKAARGIDGRRFPWGNQIDSSYANYWDSKDPFEDGTSTVGFFNGQKYLGFHTSDSQSPFGVYDLVGNVKEWVDDWYQWNYYSKGRKINPTGPESGVKKVVRGGGFLFHADNLRTTFRYALQPDKSTNFVGFRCATSTNPK